MDVNKSQTFADVFNRNYEEQPPKPPSKPMRSKKEVNSFLYGVGVNSFTRFAVFLSAEPYLKGKLYWYGLGSAYSDTDNPFRYKDLIRSAFLKDEPYREHLMSKKERDYFNNLPEVVTIYRGMTVIELQEKNFGISWTLKKEVAEFFAYKYMRNIDTRNMKKVVHELSVKKTDLIAFFNPRTYNRLTGKNDFNIGEFEVIYIR
jgi:hypothetical protein